MSPSDLCTVEVSSERDWTAVRHYLSSQWLHENAQLARLVHETPEHRDTQRVLVVKRGDGIRGVVWLNEVAGSPEWDFVTLMEVEDTAVVESVMESLPKDKAGYFKLHRRAAQDYFSKLPGVKVMHTEITFTVTRLLFEPVDGEEVVEVTKNDTHFFEGCNGWAGSALDQIGIAGRRAFAIIRDGRVATSAIMGPILTSPDRETSVAGVAAVYTEEPYRRMGLGKRLVSYMTEAALQDHKYVHYWTTPDNTASQALAESLGYWQSGTVVDYIWRTRCIRSTL